MSVLCSESHLDHVGRILVASRDITAGETVLQDNCLVAAPDGLPVCLGCLRPLGGEVYNCERCGWPLCR